MDFLSILVLGSFVILGLIILFSIFYIIGSVINWLVPIVMPILLISFLIIMLIKFDNDAKD